MTTFAYHRSVAPMMWAFVAIALIELLVVHLVLPLKWPSLAWPLSLLTGGSIAWTIWLVRSFARCPHTLEDGRLTMRAGRLRSVVVPLSNIAAIRSHWEVGELKGKGALDLALIAHPNRLIALREPIVGKRRTVDRVAIALDDPAAFDLALSHDRS